VICSIFIDGASSSSSSSSSTSFSGPADSFHRQLIMAADGLPRDEIALLYQRLKSADGTGGRSRSGKGRGTTNGTSKISQGRRKIGEKLGTKTVKMNEEYGNNTYTVIMIRSQIGPKSNERKCLRLFFPNKQLK
jgi:hypothetical protein